MVDFNAPGFEHNCKILLDGIWYADLPDIIDWSVINDHLQEVLKRIDDKAYDIYKYDQDGFIKEFVKIMSPNYIRHPGVEAITFYAFKKDGSFREMQIPNLIHYCAFIYNSLFVFHDIFGTLYLDSENDKYISHSNSYVVIGENFATMGEYDERDELAEGIFITKNNKTQERVSFGENRKQYNNCQDAFLYSAKIDIESFFPNLYTHYFEKIASYEPYSSLVSDNRYFTFLDLFHQRINNNQTKGIPAGLFSSHIAAELLMLCVDYEILEKMKDKNMDYIRYVDDMVYFSDSKQELESTVADVQRILGKYRLRINGSKTEYRLNAEYVAEQSNIVQIMARLPFLKTDESVKLQEDDFVNFKEYVTELLSAGKIVSIKAIMSLLLKRLEEKKIELIVSDIWFDYLFTLAFGNVNFVCHIYRLLDYILSQASDFLKAKYLSKMMKKTPLIETKYVETLFQIWHYYVLTKYMDNSQRSQYLIEYSQKDNVNPIILCMFVEEGDKINTQLIRIITKKMEAESNGADWKSRIMFSKWWLPLMKVRMVDSYNYYKLFQPSYFPDVITDLIGN